MRIIILLSVFFLLSINQGQAVVAVQKSSVNTITKSSKPVNENTVSNSKSNKFTLKKFFKKVAKVFEFDLSDPVDGWLSLSIVLFVGALAFALLGGLLGVPLLSLIAAILAVGGFASFIIWVIKAI